MVNNRILNGEGIVFIDNEITPELGADISRLILDLKSSEISPKIHINSIGGNVFAGYQILDSILQVSADTHIVGLAASIAAVIALHGSHRTANDNSIMMLHRAKGNNKIVVDLVNKHLREILETRTSLHENHIKEIFEEGKDLFFDASEMLQYGLVDDVKRTERKKKIDHSTFNSCAELWEVFNKLNIEDKMLEVKNKLNLKDNATEAEILNKIEKIESDGKEALDMAEALEKEKVELTNKLEEAEKNLKASAERSANLLVNNAKKEGKIKDDEEAKEWIELAIDNYAKAEKLLTSIVIDHSAHVVDAYVNKQHTEDLTKDPEKLKAFMRSSKAAELKVSNVELFNKYQEEYFKLI